jgi:hypothetical protein
MNDLELLKLAARAAKVTLVPYTWDKGAPWGEHHGFTVADQGPEEWNPLQDDGQALRLAVKLGFIVDTLAETRPRFDTDEPCTIVVQARPSHYSCGEWHGASDPEAATRLAIVRAAAEIGRLMP